MYFTYIYIGMHVQLQRMIGKIIELYSALVLWGDTYIRCRSVKFLPILSNLNGINCKCTKKFNHNIGYKVPIIYHLQFCGYNINRINNKLGLTFGLTYNILYMLRSKLQVVPV
jgi:hypothetical protein